MVRLGMPRARDGRAYTTIVPDGSPAYVAPHAAGCPATERYLAVHRIDGGWGIVDRRSGRLLPEERPSQHRYASWEVVKSVVQSMNEAR